MGWPVDDCRLESQIIYWGVVFVVVLYIGFEIKLWRDRQ
jgi:hypothetical protein